MAGRGSDRQFCQAFVQRFPEAEQLGMGLILAACTGKNLFAGGGNKCFGFVGCGGIEAGDHGTIDHLVFQRKDQERGDEAAADRSIVDFFIQRIAGINIAPDPGDVFFRAFLCCSAEELRLNFGQGHFVCGADIMAAFAVFVDTLTHQFRVASPGIFFQFNGVTRTHQLTSTAFHAETAVDAVLLQEIETFLRHVFSSIRWLIFQDFHAILPLFLSFCNRINVSLQGYVWQT